MYDRTTSSVEQAFIIQMAITEMIYKRLLIYVYCSDSVVVCNQRYLVEGEV